MGASFDLKYEPKDIVIGYVYINSYVPMNKIESVAMEKVGCFSQSWTTTAAWIIEYKLLIVDKNGNFEDYLRTSSVETSSISVIISDLIIFCDILIWFPFDMLFHHLIIIRVNFF